nr:GlxA family transcriptional regulator [Photobacterium alginatilyticum]
MFQTAKRRKVYFLLYEGVQLLDIAGPADVLNQANKSLGRIVYDIQYVGHAPNGSVISSAGLPLAVDPLPTDNVKIHTIIVPGAEVDALKQIRADHVVMQWLESATKKAITKISICSGAFLLGQLGCLDEHQSTTHWAFGSMLQDEFPNTKVQTDTLYTHDGNLWTSAGVLSGVDMMLAMVKLDLGPSIALQVARILVVFMARDGGQSQFSVPIKLQAKANRSDIVELISWLESRLNDSTTIVQMADFLGVSVRTLHRRCLQALDMTPAQILSQLRIEFSRDLLHQQNIPLKTIAYECGYSSPESFSTAFRQRFGIAPKRYRERFNI